MGAFKLPKENKEQQKARAGRDPYRDYQCRICSIANCQECNQSDGTRCALCKGWKSDAISDAMSGAAMAARASLTAAGYNVGINLNSLDDNRRGRRC